MDFFAAEPPFPPPESTVKGPFLLPVPVRHGVLSILLAPAEADVVAVATVGPDGRGNIGRSRDVPLEVA